MSISWQLADPAPALLVVPEGAASLDEAHAAIELWEHYSGKQLDLSQRLVVEVCMAQRADGNWAAATTGRPMPRQNGKGDEIEVVELWGLVQRAEAILHTVHDAALLAGQAQGRLLGVVEGHPDLRRKVKKVWRGVGQQMVEFRSGGTVWYRTRTKGGGRGLDDVDRVVVDEAQLATVEHIGAITPTLFANPNPQLNVLGSAGLPGSSRWWWSLRRRALAGDGAGFGWVEHTAERPRLEDSRVVSPAVDVNDRAGWVAANPALLRQGEQGFDFLEQQLLVLGAEAFACEHLGVWAPDAGAEVASVIPPAAWHACADPRHEHSERLSYALDVDVNAKGEEWCSIAASDGMHVEVVTPPEATAGLSWVVPTVVARRDRFGEIGIDPKGPAGKLIRPLEAEGIKVRRIKPEEFVQACGQLLDAVTAGSVRHLGQPALNRAVHGAARRDVGDGAWKLSRSMSSADISPLVAVTVARFLALGAHAPVFAY